MIFTIVLISTLLWLMGGTAVFRRVGKVLKDRPLSHESYCSKVFYNDISRDCMCNAQYHKTVETYLIGILTYISWPLMLIGYVYINTGRYLANRKGREWSFFIEPKMVLTPKEVEARYEARMKELEEQNKILEERLSIQ